MGALFGVFAFIEVNKATIGNRHNSEATQCNCSIDCSIGRLH